MCQYIDLTKLIFGVPDHDELNPSNHCEHPDIKVELPICLGEEELIESGATKAVQTCSILYNCPESHFVKFRGINTNLGLQTISGVLKYNFSGYFFVKVYNSSTEAVKLPSGMYLGSVLIKKFYNTSIL